MYNIVICDDNKQMRDSLSNQIKQFFTKKDLEYTVREFSSGEELSRYTGKVDIAFMDIEMGRINGIQAGYTLSRRNPDVVIFIVTSHNQYLDDAMDLRVFRYLTKPVDSERLFAALEIVTEQSANISFMSSHIPVTLREREVVCIYSCARKTYVLTDSGVRYPTTLSIKDWLSNVSCDSNFSHPHYSYIINLRYVSSINGRTITLKCKNGTVVEVDASQRRWKDFKMAFFAKIREQRWN